LAVEDCCNRAASWRFDLPAGIGEEVHPLTLEHFPVGLNRGDSQVLSPRRV
jgi:hypothetical protein